MVSNGYSKEVGKQSSELRIHRIVIPYITKQYIREGWCGYLDRSVIPYITKQYIREGWCGYLDRSVIPYITKQYIHARW